jgi:hypothetical protein
MKLSSPLWSQLGLELDAGLQDTHRIQAVDATGKKNISPLA